MRRLTSLFFLCVAFANAAIAQQYGSWDKEDETVFLGIESNSISKDKAKALGFDHASGRYITKVVKNSAAEQAGLQPFDYLYAIGNYQIEDGDLEAVLEKFKPGDQSTLYFIRQGKKMTAPVSFARRNAAVSAAEKAYLGVSPHSDEESDELGVKIYVVKNSTAEAMGLQDGDILLSINEIKMVDWDDITVAINQLRAGDKISIEYQREGKSFRAEQAIKSYNESKKYTVLNSNWNPDESAFLGIYSNGVSEEKAERLGFKNEHGSYITRIIGNTAAEKAGLQPFDYLYGINDYRVNADVSFTELLKKFKTGDKVTILFMRNGEPKTAEITFTKRSEAKTNISADECDAPFLGVEHQDDEAEGVAIEVIENSTAKEMGLQDGDVITKINNHRIADWDDVTIAVDNMKVGDNIIVEYFHEGKKQTATKPIKSHCETRPSESNYNYSYDKEDEEERRIPENTRIVDINLANALVDMKDLDANEAGEFKNRFGIEMLSANDLKVEKLVMAPDAKAGKFQLQFNLPQTGETSIRIFNAAGRMIYNYDLGNFSGDFTDQVNLSQNGAGNYYLEIRQGNKSATKKLILQSR